MTDTIHPVTLAETRDFLQRLSASFRPIGNEATSTPEYREGEDDEYVFLEIDFEGERLAYGFTFERAG